MFVTIVKTIATFKNVVFYKPCIHLVFGNISDRSLWLLWCDNLQPCGKNHQQPWGMFIVGIYANFPTGSLYSKQKKCKPLCLFNLTFTCDMDRNIKVIKWNKAGAFPFSGLAVFTVTELLVNQTFLKWSEFFICEMTW